MDFAKLAAYEAVAPHLAASLLQLDPAPTVEEWKQLTAVLAQHQEKVDGNQQLINIHRQQLVQLARSCAECAELEEEIAQMKAWFGGGPRPASVANFQGQTPPRQSQVKMHAREVQVEAEASKRSSLSSTSPRLQDPHTMPFAQTSLPRAPGAAEAMGAEAGPQAGVSQPLAEVVTTLSVQNLPKRLTQDDLLAVWPPDGTYNFLHLPRSNKQRRSSTYAFVNFNSTEAAQAFCTKWHGKSLQHQGRSNQLVISPSNVQGLKMNVLYSERNGEPIANDKYLPVVFDSAGQRLDFREVSRFITGGNA